MPLASRHKLSTQSSIAAALRPATNRLDVSRESVSLLWDLQGSHPCRLQAFVRELFARFAWTNTPGADDLKHM
jgi:hypothetical protein